MKKQKVHQQLYEQQHRNKIFKNVAEINYCEFDFTLDDGLINFSKKFTDRYSLFYNHMTMNFIDFVGWVHPDFQTSLKQLREELINSRVNDEKRLEVLIKYPQQKDYCWTSMIFQKITYSKYFAVQIDISELKQTIIQLEQADNQYHMMMANTSDLIAKYHLDGTCIYASNAFYKLFNLSSKEIIGKQALSLNPYLSRTTNDWYERVLKPPYQSEELIYIQNNNEEKWISWSHNVVFENNEMNHIISIGRDVTDINKIKEKMVYDAHHDNLTGLFNRDGIYQQLENMNSVTNMVSFYIEINNLKHINDYYGFKIGSLLVTEIGLILSNLKPYGCLIGRVSDDEFIVLVTNYVDKKTLLLIQTTLMDNLNKNFEINNLSVYVKSSIGFAIFPDDSKDLKKIISFSDIAMSESKLLNDKRPYRFHQLMHERLHQSIDLSKDLRTCLDSKCIKLVYQSIVDTEDDSSIKYIETLARWKQNMNGYISPTIFFEIAEQCGLVEELDMYIITNALEAFSQFKAISKYKNTKISINVYPTTFLNPEFSIQLKKIILKNKIKFKDVCIEISENTFINSMSDCCNQLIKLRKLGVLVALDDFGSKYSSLSVLDDIEFDIIKVDKTFVNKIDQVSTKSILKMIKDISFFKKKQVIIEGVETIEQVDGINLIGFNLIQGYYYSIPGPINLSELLKV